MSHQLPTNLNIDQVLQTLTSLSQKHSQGSEQTPHTVPPNHVAPSLSPSKKFLKYLSIKHFNYFIFFLKDPILLNSHLLASGAQQLLSVQPQLMAYQQQQQQAEFYRHKSQYLDHSERKEHMNQFKMRSREMSKRLSRLSRGMNGHQNETIKEVQEETTENR